MANQQFGGFLWASSLKQRGECQNLVISYILTPQKGCKGSGAWKRIHASPHHTPTCFWRLNLFEAQIHWNPAGNQRDTRFLGGEGNCSHFLGKGNPATGKRLACLFAFLLIGCLLAGWLACLLACLLVCFACWLFVCAFWAEHANNNTYTDTHAGWFGQFLSMPWAAKVRQHLNSELGPFSFSAFQEGAACFE